MLPPEGDPAAPRRAAGRFKTTRWSLVLGARSDDRAAAREALAGLCAAYWYPLYAFVRRRGLDAESAQDVVQGFLATLLERGDLASVDRGKGKLRSFLMASCSHYMANQADRARARKRGGGSSPVPIDRLAAEGRYARELADELTPERLFERRWAMTLLDQVLAALEDEMTRAGKAHLFAALRPALLGGADRVPYARIAAEIGATEEAARAAASRLRRRYREIFREEVARTLEDESAVDDEIRSLFAALHG